MIVLVRHARAEDEHPAGDEARGLTALGRKQFRAHAEWLAKNVLITRIVSSPLVRAVQTAELLAAACGVDAVEISADLSPGRGDTQRVLELVETSDRATALVGHNPSFADAAARLCRRSALPFKFKKGAALALKRGAGGFELVLFAAPGKSPVKSLEDA